MILRDNIISDLVASLRQLLVTLWRRMTSLAATTGVGLVPGPVVRVGCGWDDLGPGPGVRVDRSRSQDRAGLHTRRVTRRRVRSRVVLGLGLRAGAGATRG